MYHKDKGFRVVYAYSCESIVYAYSSTTSCSIDSSTHTSATTPITTPQNPRSLSLAARADLQVTTRVFAHAELFAGAERSRIEAGECRP